MKKVLIVFYSEKGSTQKMAIEISNGVNSISGVEAVIRTVPVKEEEENNIANENDFIYATVEDVNTCDAMIIGSPTHFGNMSSHLKFFLEKLTTVWFNGGLEGKPGGVFTSSNSIHGGQETTLEIDLNVFNKVFQVPVDTFQLFFFFLTLKLESSNRFRL